jgi:hypothetical protein
MKSGDSVAAELKCHARILANCIQYELDKVYNLYEPKVYKRTFGTYNSLMIGNLEIKVTATGVALGISLMFDENAIHKGFDGEPVNTALLLNEGWQTGFSDVPYFGQREGTHFIEKGIENYRRMMKNPFAIKLKIRDEIREF